MKKKELPYFINAFLKHYPLFHAFIRSQEAYLFNTRLRLKGKTLDFGCGDGYFAKIACYGKKIDVGLDLETSRIQESEKENIYKSRIFYDGNIIPYKNNSFDIVISNCVLEHIKKIDNSLSEIHRILKPNGYFYTTVMTKNWETYLLGRKILGKRYASFMKKQQKHFSLFPSRSWRKHFEKAGFKIMDEIGYVDERNARWLDFMHYISVPQYLLYLITKRWTVLPGLTKRLPLSSFISSKIHLPVKPSRSAAVFYILKKQ